MAKSETIIEWGLEVLDSCKTGRVEHFYFGVGSLDQIASGRILDEHRWALLDGNYLYEFLPKVNWWINVSRALANGRAEEFAAAPDLTDVKLCEFKKNVARMVDETLALYSSAMAELPEFVTVDMDEWKGEGGLELLKKYRQFTRYVTDFAIEVWPDRSIGWLADES